MAKEQVLEEEKEEGLTLEKFEEASEEVKKVTQETKLVYSEYFPLQPATRFTSNRRTCSTPALTRCAALTIRSAP